MVVDESIFFLTAALGFSFTYSFTITLKLVPLV